MEESRRARRERERWQKEMLRRLEELDRLDREHGLGTYPGPGTGRHRRPGPALLPEGPGVARQRRRHGPVIPGLLVSLLIASVIMFRDPGEARYRLQELMEGLTGKDGTYNVQTTTTGQRIGWDPCEPIRYVVNPSGAPSDWEDTVKEAVAEVSEASKFKFKYDGTTTDRDFNDRSFESDDGADPVLIGWAAPDEVPQLKGQTAGIGGGTAVRVDGRARFVTGVVVLDQDAFEDMHRSGRNDAQRLIVAHELGHVLGLDHVDDVGELMNPEYVGQRGFGDGDRKGFAVLRDLPCG